MELNYKKRINTVTLERNTVIPIKEFIKKLNLNPSEDITEISKENYGEDDNGEDNNVVIITSIIAHKCENETEKIKRGKNEKRKN